MSLVLPYLLLGDEENSKSVSFLLDQKVGFVLNLAPELGKGLKGVPGVGEIEFKSLGVPDSECNAQNLDANMDEYFEFIDKGRKIWEEKAVKDEQSSPPYRVLVHCQAGISRSSTIVIAYVMRTEKLSLRAAFEKVKLAHITASPNRGFFELLIKRDIAANGKPSVTIDEFFEVNPVTRTGEWRKVPWDISPIASETNFVNI